MKEECWILIVERLTDVEAPRQKEFTMKTDKEHKGKKTWYIRVHGRLGLKV